MRKKRVAHFRLMGALGKEAFHNTGQRVCCLFSILDFKIIAINDIICKYSFNIYTVVPYAWHDTTIMLD